ncbi:hypothetical protein Tco_1225300, partial [Tanacetum coccineum]
MEVDMEHRIEAANKHFKSGVVESNDDDKLRVSVDVLREANLEHVTGHVVSLSYRAIPGEFSVPLLILHIFK